MQNVKTYQEYFSRKSLEYRAILIIPDKSNFPITRNYQDRQKSHRFWVFPVKYFLKKRVVQKRYIIPNPLKPLDFTGIMPNRFDITQ